MSDIITSKSLKSKTELYALALTQNNEGNPQLYDFVINRNTKKLMNL